MGSHFLVEQVLVPTLVPGDQVIMTTCLLTSPASNRQSSAPAALFARLQSHRTSLRQTQGPAQKGRRSNRR